MQTSNARLYNVILNECEESPHRYQQLKIDSGQLTVVVPPADWIKFSPSVKTCGFATSLLRGRQGVFL